MYAEYKAPCCHLFLRFIKYKLIAIDFELPIGLEEIELPLLWKIQLDHYFSGQLRDFEYPIAEQGTIFQKKVWQEIKNIPYGQTYSYKSIAQQLNSHPRAVGRACGSNPLPIIIPCHRVLRHDGSLGGYAFNSQGVMLEIKRYLLNLEQEYEAI